MLLVPLFSLINDYLEFLSTQKNISYLLLALPNITREQRKEIIRKELQQPVRTFWKDYKKVAVEYYKEYIMDKKIKSMAENENRRANEDIIQILENFSGN